MNENSKPSMFVVQEVDYVRAASIKQIIGEMLRDEGYQVTEFEVSGLEGEVTMPLLRFNIRVLQEAPTIKASKYTNEIKSSDLIADLRVTYTALEQVCSEAKDQIKWTPAIDHARKARFLVLKSLNALGYYGYGTASD